jgi:hypothetical protein
MLKLGDVKIGGQGRNVEIFHRAIRGGLGESMGVWGSRWEFGPRPGVVIGRAFCLFWRGFRPPDTPLVYVKFLRNSSGMVAWHWPLADNSASTFDKVKSSVSEQFACHACFWEPCCPPPFLSDSRTPRTPRPWA